MVWTKEDYLDKGLPADYLRYYLLDYTSHTRELDFSWKEFQARINNELVNTFGNFANRTLNLIKNKLGHIPECAVEAPVFEEISKSLAAIEEAVRAFEFKAAVDNILLLASYGNSYISNEAPWKLLKTDVPRAEQVLRNCLQIVKACALVMQPAMPDFAQKLWEMLGYQDAVEAHPVSDAMVPFENTVLGDVKPLFARIEDAQREELEAVLAKRAKEAKEASAKSEGKSEGKKDEKKTSGEKPMTEEEFEPISTDIVTIDDVAKLDLRVGEVVKCEKVEKADRLLRLQVDIGCEVRQIVSSIAKEYTPEEMVGKKIIVIVNLKPAKFRGEESNGMLFAAGESASLLIPLRDVPNGTKVH